MPLKLFHIMEREGILSNSMMPDIKTGKRYDKIK
jgi:hypothetical protein